MSLVAMLALSTLSCYRTGDIITVPTRLCAIEGSPQAKGHGAGTLVAGAEAAALVSRVRAASSIWEGGAGIAFSIGDTYPVIADPEPPGSDKLGDVDDTGWPTEPAAAARECEAAWEGLGPHRSGPVIVNARTLTSGAIALADSAPLSLWVKQVSPLTGKRGDDLCGSPRRLTADDVSDKSIVMVDQGLFTGTSIYRGDPSAYLAHELGHTLLLGHGNGLDDDHNGNDTKSPGPRRFDEFCDPQGTGNPPTGDEPVEDALTSWVDCGTSSSVMFYSGSTCRKIHPLQEEQAREVALMIPGATLETPPPSP